MILAKVKSRVISTAKVDRLPSRALLWVEPEAEFGSEPLIAIDGVQAGPGDRVLVMQEGTGAREVVSDDPSVPMAAQAVIVGIVDQVFKE